jgi:retron-type reverse transcriptase
MLCVARRIIDRNILALIKMWLKAPVEERDGDGGRRMSGGKSSTCGTPQGGVASPLLANLYMNRFLKHWRATGRREAFRAHVAHVIHRIRRRWPKVAILVRGDGHYCAPEVLDLLRKTRCD